MEVQHLTTSTARPELVHLQGSWENKESKCPPTMFSRSRTLVAAAQSVPLQSSGWRSFEVMAFQHLKEASKKDGERL